jgi:hypothetical protein
MTINFRYLLAIIGFLLLNNSASAQIKRIPGVIGIKNNYENHLLPATRSEDEIPASYSLRKYAPPIGDQGTTATCVGWSTTYAGMSILENIMLKRNGSEVNSMKCFSPQLTYDICRFDYDNDCSMGLYILNALNMLKDIGTLRYEKYPPACEVNLSKSGLQRIYNDSISQDSLTEFLSDIKTTRLSGFIPIGGANIIDNVKYYLSKNMPVIFSMEMYNSLQSIPASSVWSGETDNFNKGHAMCVVGYNDNKEGGAFEILNSWGTEWADSGYVWFKYSDFAKVSDEAYALKGLIKNSKTEKNLNNFDLTITAYDSETKKNIPILEVDNPEYNNKKISSKGAFAYTYNVEYPKNVNAIKLKIVNNLSEYLYVYAFNLNNFGYVSLVNSLKNDRNKIDNFGAGLNIPDNELSSIKVSDINKGACLVFSKFKIDYTQLEPALGQKYQSLQEFMELNFAQHISVNKANTVSWKSGKLTIKNKNELNQILPVFIVPKIEEKAVVLFEPVSITFEKLVDNSSFDYLKTYIEDFKRNYYGFKLDINIDRQSKNYIVSVKCYMNQEMMDDYNEFYNQLDENKKIEFEKYNLNNQNEVKLFDTQFICNSKNIVIKLKENLTRCLLENEVDFILKNYNLSK